MSERIETIVLVIRKTPPFNLVSRTLRTELKVKLCGREDSIGFDTTVS